MAQPTPSSLLSASLSGPEVERRAFVRYPASPSSGCRTDSMSESYRCRWARTLNISRGGIGLLLPREFERGTPLTLLVKSEVHDMLYELQAKVVETTRQSDGQWLIGCEFFICLREEQMQALLA